MLERFDRIVTEGWACWAFSNHDVERYASRFDLNEAQRKLYAAILMTLKGTVCLYQGEELGLTEAYVPYEDLQDPYGKRFWPKYKGRDGCRTPMPWTQEHFGGFTDVRPWLPVAVEHLDRAVSVQERDLGSTLTFYRAFIGFRRTIKALSKGDLEILEANDERLVMIRQFEDLRVFVAYNLLDVPCVIPLPEGDWVPRDDAPFQAVLSGRQFEIGPYQGAFAISATG